MLIMCKAMEEMRRIEREEGREEGIEIAQTRNAKKMLSARKLPFEEIAEYSGLPLEEVKRLAAEQTE